MKIPWHIWVVGVVSLLWNAGGAYDYYMTQTGNEAYLAMMNEPQRAFMEGLPTWFHATWAIGVWFSVLGSVLILMRSRYAAPAFGLSLLGLLASAVWTYGLADPSALEIMGSFSIIFSAAICVILVLLMLYARAMARRGVLR